VHPDVNIKLQNKTTITTAKVLALTTLFIVISLYKFYGDVIKIVRIFILS